MITDEVFRKELDATLKCRGLIKRERNRIIEDYLQLNIDRNDVLDMEKEITLQYSDSKAKPRSEAEEQIEFINWFKQSYPNIEILMIPNENIWSGIIRQYVKPIELANRIIYMIENKLKAMGKKKGVSDLLIPDLMIWIEMKRSDGGAGQSQEQKDFEQGRIKAGQTYLLCNGADEAKRHVAAILG